MNYARIASKLREKIIKLSGELSAGMPKVVHRFITESLYGVQARQSVRLTEIEYSISPERNFWIAVNKYFWMILILFSFCFFNEKVKHESRAFRSHSPQYSDYFFSFSVIFDFNF